MEEYNEIEDEQDRIELEARNEALKYVGKIDKTKPNSMCPPPPAPGTIMKCQLCEGEMLPKNFSKNEAMRKKEFKWHIHEACFLEMDKLIDRSTPGLISERYKKS